MRKRIVLLVAVIVALSSLVVELRHRNRERFVSLQKLQAERDALDTEWGQLLLEQATWSEHRRVEGMARNIGMLLPRAEQVTVVRYRNIAPE